MTWTEHSIDVWQEAVSDRIDDLADDDLATYLSKFELVPFGLAGDTMAQIHDGRLSIDGDFTPPGPLTAIFGDLHVSGTISTAGVPGMDGNVTLLVFGEVTCGSIVNDWASILAITKTCTVKNWVFAAREDSSFVVGGDFQTPVFVGFDIWVSVGGSADMEYGLGYAVGLNQSHNPALMQPVYPRQDWRALAVHLAIELSDGAAEYDLIERLEERLYQTGDLSPPGQTK